MAADRVISGCFAIAIQFYRAGSAEWYGHRILQMFRASREFDQARNGSLI